MLCKIHITLNRGGGEHGKSKGALLIRPSRTPKTNKVFAYYGRQYMDFVCEFLYVFFQNLGKINLSQKTGKKHTKPSAKGDARLK